MEQLKSHQELLTLISELGAKLENGQLSISELDEYTSAIRSLYERAIILKYKAFEEKVGVVTEEEVHEIKEVFEPSPEPEVVEEPVSEETENEEQNEEPIFDFGIFDNPAETELLEHEKEVEEHISITHSEKEEEGLKVEETTIEARVETSIPSTNNLESFDNYFNQIVNSMQGQLGFTKLDSLVGSFGLNERLQFINELFDGSSESFSEAIKSLDTQASIDAAKNKTKEFASDNDWDLESDTVEEFIIKLCRRYA